MTSREVLDGIVDGTIGFDDLVEFALDVIEKEVLAEFQSNMNMIKVLTSNDLLGKD